MQHSFSTPAAKAESQSAEPDDKAYSLSLDLPVVAKDQLDILIESNQLRIETKPEASRAYRAAYEFPTDLDAARSEAKLESGVLTVKLAKQAPQSNAVSLAIA